MKVCVEYSSGKTYVDNLETSEKRYLGLDSNHLVVTCLQNREVLGLKPRGLLPVLPASLCTVISKIIRFSHRFKRFGGDTKVYLK